jgi:integrase
MPKKLSNALTTLQVKNAKSGRHADGRGLHLLVKATGSRSWVFRFMLNGRSRDLGLSRCPEAVALLRVAGGEELTLEQARDIAAIYRLKVKAGIDPLEEREQDAADKASEAIAAKAKAMTFKSAAEAYISANEASWRNDKHRQQWRNTLASYVYPVIGDLSVSNVTTAHVLKIIEPIWNDKPETASRVRGRIETVLNAAKARGYREGENPARWRGHIEQILPGRSKLTRGHHKAMPYAEVATFISDLSARQAVAALALEFTILTAARTSEVTGMTWDEVDLAKAVWTIPAKRMKAGNEHRIPLSNRAVEILEAVSKLGQSWVFFGNKGKLSSMAMAMLLRRMDRDVTVHGFRSAFRDWAAECTGYSHEVCEMALAHVIGNKAEAAYRRGDLFEKRRRLMDDWASFCLTPRGSIVNITSIRSKAAV